jgi:clan AA aspartic protease
MINGLVNAIRQPRLNIEVQGPGSQLVQVDAHVDTGSSGFLTLPSAVISALGLPWLHRVQNQLADGSYVFVDTYEATVIWDG